MSFCHLHRHSEYSLLDGIGTAKQYAEQAANWNQEALALTDHGNISGALQHYESCLEANVKPILGMEAYFVPDRSQRGNDHRKSYHLVLLAKNFVGWQNLVRISSEAYRSGFYGKPRIDYELLKKYSEGVICNTACLSSYPNFLIMQGDSSGALEAFRELQVIFKDDLHIEIMPHDFEEQKTLNKELVGISYELSLPLIATVDAHYPFEGWQETQDIMLMVSTKQSFEKRKAKEEDGIDIFKFDCDSLWLMPEEDVSTLFENFHPDLPKNIVEESIKNTKLVADKVTTFEISKKNKMPKVQADSEKELWELCGKRLAELGLGENEEYLTRLQHEFDTIKSVGALDYIYIVYDMVRFARSQKILVGSGRGSSGGSLLCYLIGITEVDPIPYGLIFERFFNVDRVSMPDIDVDFDSNRISEVEDYLKETWGSDKVSSVCSFMTFKPSSILKAVSRVYDIPFDEINPLTKQLEKDLENNTLELVRKNYPDIDSFMRKNQEITKHAERLEGQVHTLSEHASAIVIMDRPINDFMPTIRSKKGEEVTGWSDKASFPIISNYGMLKIDALSTKTLGIQGACLELIKENKGIEVDINALPICDDPYAVDENVMDAFKKGLCVGIWQFGGSGGFSSLIKNIKPDSMFDIAAANAIYRPGPIGGGMLQAYPARKNGREKIEYFHDDAEEILKNNYGLILYQEDVMKIAQKFANFTGTEADTLRKVMGKEYRQGMAHVKKYLKKNGYEEKFREGCLEYGLDDETVSKVWKQILAFGGYGFNLSHAVVYGITSYQDMWLKVNYPAEFYTALLSVRSKLVYDINKEARAFGIKISPPNINKSMSSFTVLDKKILFGLSAIKGIGPRASAIIDEKRPFKSYEDFVERVPPRACNAGAKQALIKSGAFDDFGMREDFTEKDKLEEEVNILGIALSKPDIIVDNESILQEYIETEEELKEKNNNYQAVVGGEIDKITEIKTKTGLDMAFVEISYFNNSANVTLFPETWEKYKEIIYKGNSIIVRGKKNTYNGKVSYVASFIMPILQFVEEIKCQEV